MVLDHSKHKNNISLPGFTCNLGLILIFMMHCHTFKEYFLSKSYHIKTISKVKISLLMQNISCTSSMKTVNKNVSVNKNIKNSCSFSK